MTVQFPVISNEDRVKRLEPAHRKVRAVLDTDTFNEIDDQFAICYALLSPESISLQAIYAAPFHNELSDGPKDGMEKSYNEIVKVLELMKSSVPSYPGSESYLPGPETFVESPAARHLVELAMASSDEDPLYVFAIGAITNVASAILMQPEIIRKIVVVWLGGHSFQWQDTREFNLQQDLHASRIMMDSGVPLVLIPCMGVTSHLTTTLPEIREYVREQGEIGHYLYDIFEKCTKDHLGASRVIWDMTTIAYTINPEWTPSSLVPSPHISDQFRWSFDSSRHLIRYVDHIHRDPIFKDFFSKLKRQ
ncbi:nucleoside hydrolase [Paenibacillus sp. FSL H8-0548]|uniref:nucleoside hydrolase n=1 Tax=Paenibacillus sp. FSL H8-0548 TaxID=1920422 RepID=UPI00096D90B3|nr:nucleoside hydrolase [Paenibacillus sp. FSL H8-0548]OMF22251.1 nucleoside hydrolase [Paenibacillus sp. FSL H8-0548]